MKMSLAILIEKEINKCLKGIDNYHLSPTLLVMDNPDDPNCKSHLQAIRRIANRVGVTVNTVSDKLNNIPSESILSLLQAMAMHADAVIVQRPYPQYYNSYLVATKLPSTIYAASDSSIDHKMLDTNTNSCVTEAIRVIIDDLDRVLVGAKSVVLGRSNVIGKLVAEYLLQKDTTVTICHSKTKPTDMYDACSSADIIVSTMGNPNIFNSDGINLKSDVDVIDCGVNYVDGVYCGDVNGPILDSIIQHPTQLIVPYNNIGSLSIAILMREVVKKSLIRAMKNY